MPNRSVLGHHCLSPCRRTPSCPTTVCSLTPPAMPNPRNAISCNAVSHSSMPQTVSVKGVALAHAALMRKTYTRAFKYLSSPAAQSSVPKAAWERCMYGKQGREVTRTVCSRLLPFNRTSARSDLQATDDLAKALDWNVHADRQCRKSPSERQRC